ncbi:MAG: hypothetical protein IJ131_04645 [Eggerthellaceae bacterium]|nr:hypothetical protein [Eggerthellaceae bacterium]
MRYVLIEVNEEKREIVFESEDKAYTVTVDASGEAWSGKETDLEVLTSPGGATIYYYEADGKESYVNYRFTQAGAEKVA